MCPVRRGGECRDDEPLIALALLAQCEANFQDKNWLLSILELRETDFESHRVAERSGRAADASWFLQQAQLRLRKIRQMMQSYEPWRLPEFAPLRDELGRKRLRRTACPCSNCQT